MLSKYYEDWEVKPEFEKEFISLWPGWLGMENYHKLDKVTEEEWRKFNIFIRLLNEKFDIYEVNLDKKSCETIRDIETVLPGYEEDLEREYGQFTKLIIPELEAVLTEEWDYTYILWHKDNGAKESIAPLVNEAGLYQFYDENT